MIVMEGFSSKKFSTFALLLSGELQPWDAMGARTVITGIAGSTTTGTSKCREQNFPSQLPSPWKVYRPLHLVLAESRNDKRNTFQCQYISCVYVCVLWRLGRLWRLWSTCRRALTRLAGNWWNKRFAWRGNVLDVLENNLCASRCCHSEYWRISLRPCSMNNSHTNSIAEKKLLQLASKCPIAIHPIMSTRTMSNPKNPYVQNVQIWLWDRRVRIRWQVSVSATRASYCNLRRPAQVISLVPVLESSKRISPCWISGRISVESLSVASVEWFEFETTTSDLPELQP